ncbi:MAG: lipoprotein [Legionellaceae bacterium]|nr:lipoprotein [Legionellaceae bacterium]
MKKIISIVIVTILICSCGQQGPLYLPNDPPIKK